MNRRKAIGTAGKVGAAVVATAIVAGGAAYYAGTASAPTQTTTVTAGGGTQTTTVTAGGGTQTQTVTSTVTQSASSSGGLSGEITLGFLGSLSQWDQAPLNLVASQVAVKDINDYLNSINAGFSFALQSEDSALSAPTALQKTQLYNSQGVRYILGADSSGQCAAMLNYANSNNMVLFSQSSTSDQLRIPNDALFRAVIPNAYEGAATIGGAQNVGAKFLGIINNQQAGNQDLANVAQDYAKKAGIETFAVGYAPNATEFSSQVSLLDGAVKSAIQKYGGPQYVNVLASGFDETATILQEASSYPELMQVIWWGNDSSAESPAVLKNAGQQASTVHFYNTNFYVTPTAYEQQIAKKLADAAKQEVGVYGIVSYDTVWYIAMTILAARSADPTVVKRNLISTSQYLYGASGPLALDANGDRAGGAEGFWGVRKNPNTGSYEWYVAGAWDSITGNVSWSIPPTQPTP